jgi:NOL1/NOP2/sun family putative RNA methylase
LERYRPLVDDWQAFCRSSLEPLPLTIWANPLRLKPGALPPLLAEEALTATPLPGLPDAYRIQSVIDSARIGRSWPYLAGLLHVQEAVSMLPVPLLDVRPGQRVLDLCAAPGNKTAQIAFALGNRGTVVANDPYVDRLRALRQNLDRLGVRNVSVTRRDGTSYPGGAGRFDRILVDAPCSCEGTTRKNRRVLETIDEQGRARLIHVQRELLRRAAKLLRPGGRLVYSTCTYAPEENELVVDELLRSRDDLRLRSARLPGLLGSPGLASWQGVELHPDMPHCLRLWPHHNDSGGFFVALIERTTAEADRPAPPDPRPPRADVDAAHWRRELEQRYGLSDEAFAGTILVRQRKEGLHLLPADHRPPAVPRPESRGLYLLRTDPRYPKPTTEGVVAFGAWASRQVVDLEPEELATYLARRAVTLPPERVTRCPDAGYVIVRRLGHPLGIGVWLPGKDAGPGAAGTLESQYPKGLSPAF